MTDTLRPFRPEDREAIVAIGNRDRPPHRHSSAEGWKRMDARLNAERIELRLCIADPTDDHAVAYLGIVDLNTTGFKMADVCEFDLTVAHAHRRQGNGSRLYDRALEFAGDRGAKRLITWFREWTEDEPAMHFLKARGFEELERETPSYLDLTNWDAVPFTHPLGVDLHLFSYAEVEDTFENRHRLYELQKALIYDIPRRDDQPFTFEPFEDWQKFVLDRPDWRPDLCLLAEAGGEWVGQCHVMPKMETPHVGMQWLTGVSSSQRGRGLATALKVAAYEHARDSAVTTIITENHEDNAPMLAINRKFGFIPEPAAVSYHKAL